jgi:glycosyltransferase involved in cell wall biosynthesis
VDGSIEECLKSIDLIVTELSIRLIVVDNYSNDGQFPIIKKYQNIHL